MQKKRKEILKQRLILPGDQCTRSVYPAPMQQLPPVPDLFVVRTRFRILDFDPSLSIGRASIWTTSNNSSNTLLV